MWFAPRYQSYEAHLYLTIMNRSSNNQSRVSEQKLTDNTHGQSSRSTLWSGLIGGLFATVVMTLFRMPTTRSLPPTAEFLGQYLGGDPKEYHVMSLILHMLYGTMGGIIFGLLAATSIDEANEPELTGLLVGSVYGLILSVFGEHVVLHHLLEMNLETDESAVFHASHLMYGLTLGVWTGSRSC